MTRYIAVARPEVIGRLVEQMTPEEYSHMQTVCYEYELLPEEYVGRLLLRADRWHLVSLVGIAEVVDPHQV